MIDIDVDAVGRVIREEGRPVHVNRLAREALRSWLEARAAERIYAPGGTYQVGETIRVDESQARVLSVGRVQNPVQGPFDVLTIQFPDGREERIAARIAGAPREDTRPARTEATELPEADWQQHGFTARQAVHSVLSGDVRFVHCQMPQGDYWCLCDMLPNIGPDELQKALDALPADLVDGEIVSRSTEELVEALWGSADDGSDDYVLLAFALHQVLRACDVVACLGDTWASRQALDAYAARPTLFSPRVLTHVTLPAGVELATEDEIRGIQTDEESPDGDRETSEPEESGEIDLEAWRQTRPDTAILTLSARHYTLRYLPLRKDVRRLFPPLESGMQEVLFHYDFLGQTGCFQALVNQDQKRILLNPTMHGILQQCRVYPGARLQIGVRNTREFDLATRPATRTEPIRVWRMCLDENRAIAYDDFEESPRYDTDVDVYVAEARFEDLDALWQQAAEAGNSIFGLMYQKAVEWWEAGGRRPVEVSVNDLFDAIHFDEQGRMTRKATIAYELWRRRAFESLGDGRYGFRPKYGAATRQVGPAAPASRTALQPQTPAGTGDKSTTPVVSTGTDVSSGQDRSTGPSLEDTDVEPAFFVLQQRTDSEYADQVGVVYNWRKGIPGSRQITAASRFIYYRPGAGVFFGSGRVESIDEYVDDDGQIYYDGHVVDYEAWDPPLRLDRALAEQLSFVSPDRLGVGTAGIRKIARADFECIIDAYLRQGAAAVGAESVLEETDQLWNWVMALQGRELQTLTQGKPFRVVEVTPKKIVLEMGADSDRGTLSDLTRKKLAAAWDVLVRDGELTLRRIQEVSCVFYSSYGAAILAQLPGVTYETRPIKLHLERVQGDEPDGMDDHTVGELSAPGTDTSPGTESRESARFVILDRQRVSEPLSRLEFDYFGLLPVWLGGPPAAGDQILFYDHREHVFFGQASAGFVQDERDENYRVHRTVELPEYEMWEPPLALDHELATHLSIATVDAAIITNQLSLREIPEVDAHTILETQQRRDLIRHGQTPPPDLVPALWPEVVRLKGSVIETLRHRRPLTIDDVTDTQVELLVGSAGRKHSVSRGRLEAAWKLIVLNGELLEQEARTICSQSKWIHATAVLAALPDVTYKLEPLCLNYRPTSQDQAEDESLSANIERTSSGQLVAVDLVPPGPIFEIDGTQQPPSEAPSAEKPQSEIDLEFEQIREILQSSCVGQTIYTLVRQKPNVILEATHSGLMVKTEKGQACVKWEWIKNVYDKLCSLGEIEASTIQKGTHRVEGAYRGAFICALLAGFVHIEAHNSPRRLIYHEPAGRIRLRAAADEDDDRTPARPDPPSEILVPAPPPAPQQPRQTPQKREDMQTKTLFSRHYLENRLTEHPEWADDPRQAFETVRALWQKAQEYGDSWNEAQTEDEFVKPVLKALGWSFVVQPKAHHGARVTRPDYALFPDERSCADAYRHQGDDAAFYSRALAIAEAKYWGRPLSQQDSSGRSTWKAESNPSHQMVSYLVGTRAGWGILTNGIVWRLYSREVSSTASEYYEVDLGLIFDHMAPDGEPSADQLDAFRRWWLFFQRQSFTPDAQGKHFVQRVHESSATYAREISEKLKELVFEEVMPEIAGGFVAYRHDQMNVRQETEEGLREIYQASLNLLYKLLFLLYAEARALLPVANPGYREQSLTAMAQWAAERRDRALPLSDATHATGRYNDLLALFHRIDQGDPSLGIPRYNGGLFNPQNSDNEFLERHKLSDRAVACAIDTLVRDAGQPVDYAYISVRNLGAIYEGLLENKLRVVDAAKGQVELVNDKGERKATGSYYTPDYIVEYIVEQTLDPILDERAVQFETAMGRCAELRRQLKRTSDAATARRLRGDLDRAECDAREAFLGIKVLDPAMGSGHFLVNAVDHLTDGIIERLQRYHDAHDAVPWEWNPIQRVITTVRGAIQDEMARHGIAVEPDRLDDTALLTRLVMKRCIYGVDLNKMAVELAKVSLWLHSFTVGAPLSFLDHHLRWGNSLIGTDVQTVQRAIEMTDTGQLGLFAGPFAGLLGLTKIMTEVVERSDATLADVRRSTEDYELFQNELTPYKQVLDLWVSQWFGNDAAKEFLTVHGQDVLPAVKGELEVKEDYAAAIERARELWQERRFFHWDLEFPEVFVDLRTLDWSKNPGFDAVVGNPPYGTASDRCLQQVLAINYPELSVFDLFVAFIRRGIQKLGYRAMLGYIVPTSWLTGLDYSDFRGVLLRACLVSEVVKLPFDVFSDAYVDTAIVVLRKARDWKSELDLLNGAVRVYEFGKHEDAEHRLTTGLDYEVIASQIWTDDRYLRFVINPGVLRLRRVLAGSDLVELGVISQSVRGILADARDIDAGRRTDDWRPYFDGDVYRYQLIWKNRKWVRYGENLREKPGSTRFFDGPRILVRRLVNRRARLMATYAVEGFVNKKDIYNLVIEAEEYDPLAVLALLNSSLMSYLYIAQSEAASRDDFPQLTLTDLRHLPIRRVARATVPSVRDPMVAEGARIANLFLCGAAGVNSPIRFAAASASVYEWVSARIGESSTHPTMVDQVDVVFGLMAKLAARMIDDSANRQRLADVFFLDLGGYLNAKQLQRLNRLHTPKRPPKEGIKNYEERNQNYEQSVQIAQAQLGDLADERLELDDFWRLNQAQWMWLLRQNLGDVDNMSQLVAVWEKHRANLAPIMRRIERTDWLIDQIVYQLYGLSEAEIAIVEGRVF